LSSSFLSSYFSFSFSFLSFFFFFFPLRPQALKNGTLPQVLATHAAEKSSHPLFTIIDKAGHEEDISAANFLKRVQRLAHYLQTKVGD
jgi:hypothetical protein